MYNTLRFASTFREHFKRPLLQGKLETQAQEANWNVHEISEQRATYYC